MRKIGFELNFQTENKFEKIKTPSRIIGPRFLLDVGALSAAKTIDRKRCEMLRRKFGLCCPDLFFAAFPGLFPTTEETADKPAFATEIIEQFKRALLLQDTFTGTPMELTMQLRNRFSPRWWLDRARGLMPEVIRSKYQYANIPLWRGYCCDFKTKTAVFIRELRTGSQSGAGVHLQNRATLNRALFPPEP